MEVWAVFGSLLVLSAALPLDTGSPLTPQEGTQLLTETAAEKSAFKAKNVETTFAQGTTTSTQSGRTTNGKRCVYVHGIGGRQFTTPEKITTPLSDADREKYKPPVLMQIMSEHCSETVEFSQNTSDNAWFDEELYSRVCSIVSDNAKDGVIRNTHIITGSMGTLTFAAGVEAGKCSLDHSTSKWHVLGSPPASMKPLSGTHMHAMQNPDTQGAVMQIYAPHADTISGLTGLYLLNDKGEFGRSWQCILETEKCDRSPPEERRLAVNHIIASQVSSAMCGRCPGGISKGVLGSLAEHLAYATAPEKTDTDGAVTYDQCTYNFREHSFSGTPDSDFYAICGNHLDVCGYTEDGEDADKRPAEYLKNILTK